MSLLFFQCWVESHGSAQTLLRERRAGTRHRHGACLSVLEGARVFVLIAQYFLKVKNQENVPPSEQLLNCAHKQTQTPHRNRACAAVSEHREPPPHAPSRLSTYGQSEPICPHPRLPCCDSKPNPSYCLTLLVSISVCVSKEITALFENVATRPVATTASMTERFFQVVSHPTFI